MELWDKVYWVLKVFGPLEILELYEKVRETYQELGKITPIEVSKELEMRLDSGYISYTFDGKVKLLSMRVDNRMKIPLY